MTYELELQNPDVRRHLGDLFVDLVDQILRLRRLEIFDCSPEAVFARLLEEAEEYDQALDDDMIVDEAGDVLAMAAHLALVASGGDHPGEALCGVLDKLQRRLDAVEHRGLTWAQAKDAVG